VRYADDCSIFLGSKRAAQRVLASITQFLEKKLRLEVNEEKTSICRPVKFTLLGHGFVSSYKKGDKGVYRLCIARKSWERLKLKIKVITRKTRPATVGERIAALNLLMRGWVNYFRHATGFQKLRDLDAWIRWCERAAVGQMDSPLPTRFSVYCCFNLLSWLMRMYNLVFGLCVENLKPTY